MTGCVYFPINFCQFSEGKQEIAPIIHKRYYGAKNKVDIFKCSHFWWQFFLPLNLTSAIRRHIYSTRAPSHTLSLLFLLLFALPLTLLGWVPSSSQWGRCVAVFYPRGTPFTLFHLSIGCFFIMHSWFSLSGDSSHQPRVSMEICDWPTVKGLWGSKWWILPCNEMCCCCSGVVYHTVHQNALDFSIFASSTVM